MVNRNLEEGEINENNDQNQNRLLGSKKGNERKKNIWKKMGKNYKMKSRRKESWI